MTTLPLRLTLLERHQTLRTLSHFRTHHLVEVLEEGVEALHRALVGIRDDDVLLVLELGELLQEEGDRRLEARGDVVAEVEALLQRVDVEDDGAGACPPPSRE